MGCSMADHMRAELVADALAMAAAARGGATNGNIFHEDCGSEYRSRGHRTLIDRLGMRQSIGRTGVVLRQRRGPIGLVVT